MIQLLALEEVQDQQTAAVVVEDLEEDFHNTQVEARSQELVVTQEVIVLQKDNLVVE